MWGLRWLDRDRPERESPRASTPKSASPGSRRTTGSLVRRPRIPAAGPASTKRWWRSFARTPADQGRHPRACREGLGGQAHHVGQVPVRASLGAMAGHVRAACAIGAPRRWARRRRRPRRRRHRHGRAYRAPPAGTAEGQRREPPPPPAAPDHHPALTPEEQAISRLPSCWPKSAPISPDGRSATEREVLAHLLGEERAAELIGEDVIVVDASGAAIAPATAKPAAWQDKPLADTPASAAPSPAAPAEAPPRKPRHRRPSRRHLRRRRRATASIFPRNLAARPASPSLTASPPKRQTIRRGGTRAEGRGGPRARPRARSARRKRSRPIRASRPKWFASPLPPAAGFAASLADEDPR